MKKEKKRKGKEKEKRISTILCSPEILRVAMKFVWYFSSFGFRFRNSQRDHSTKIRQNKRSLNKMEVLQTFWGQRKNPKQFQRQSWQNFGQPKSHPSLTQSQQRKNQEFEKFPSSWAMKRFHHSYECWLFILFKSLDCILILCL